MRKYFNTLNLVLFILVFVSCDDPWQQHLNEYNMDRANSNLLEIIQDTPELSKFAQLVESAELGEQLSTSLSTTLWAPTNSAIEALNIDENPEQLIRFIQNHLTRGLFPLDPEQNEFRCKMLNGKHVTIDMSQGMINGTIFSGSFNNMATNGLVHIVDQAIDLRPNIWEYIEESDLDLKQIDYLNSLTGIVFDDSIAEQIGFDPISSAPLYDTLSGMVWYNQFVNEHADLKNEDSLFTLLLVENSVFDEHFERFSPYYLFKETDPIDPVKFTNYKICEDLVSSGYHTSANSIGNLISVSGINVPFQTSAIIESIEASNGIIHRINACDLSLVEKFPPIIIQGECIDKYIYTGGGKVGYTRQKPLADGGYDFVLDDHDGNPGLIVYHAGMVAATRYDFYWKAVDDFNQTYYGSAPDTILRQKLEKVIYLPEAPVENMFPVHRNISDSLIYVIDQSYETAEERLAGSFLFTNYEDLWLQLVGSGNNTSITLDYLKIVPVFEE